ncbi:bacteriohemerythrin [Clostridium weizhouense]|uniref:Hemerythrin family protein n=1 Tax=Clostridium weizhouense TaxID=2859781 RepID=A0ABS7AL71_9CLOT|nr:hemerythrin family protein [Clostridium weizhouense]MBW6409309.1 hemerythrin family protein [Clostridium weizhouense]
MNSWSEKYSTNVELIDTQHKKLFEILDQCYELLLNPICLDKYDKILHILDELKEYTSYHFKCEEEYQLSIGYTKFLSHKVMHDEFIKRLNDVNLSEIDNDQDKYLNSLLDFVQKWIVEHILYVDKEIPNNTKKS